MTGTKILFAVVVTMVWALIVLSIVLGALAQ